MRIVWICTFLNLTLSLWAQGPYSPASHALGTTAIHKDSSILSSWANRCQIQRGYQDIANPSKGYATVGDSTNALGKAQTNGVVSLGDGGMATLTFDGLIYNGVGADFAIFENGFAAIGGGDYLELAFVEVSSDGQNFYRFPAHSLTDTAAVFGSFGTLDPSELNNLAGKYYTGYGTPFDLEEMKGVNGLDVNAISHLRIIDVVGSKNLSHASLDTASRVILDPYPTAFPSGGFDLDAAAAIHITAVGIKEKKKLVKQLFPNPTTHFVFVNHDEDLLQYSLLNLNGKVLKNGTLQQSDKLDLREEKKGIYILRLQTATSSEIFKLVKQ